VSISFQVPLADLAPGEYQCQISVLDPEGNRASFRQGSILLVQ
jgi:hypothetical protein